MWGREGIGGGLPGTHTGCIASQMLWLSKHRLTTLSTHNRSLYSEMKLIQWVKQLIETKFNLGKNVTNNTALKVLNVNDSHQNMTCLYNTVPNFHCHCRGCDKNENILRQAITIINKILNVINDTKQCIATSSTSTNVADGRKCLATWLPGQRN